MLKSPELEMLGKRLHLVLEKPLHLTDSVYVEAGIVSGKRQWALCTCSGNISVVFPGFSLAFKHFFKKYKVHKGKHTVQ